MRKPTDAEMLVSKIVSKAHADHEKAKNQANSASASMKNGKIGSVLGNAAAVPADNGQYRYPPKSQMRHKPDEQIAYGKKLPNVAGKK